MRRLCLLTLSLLVAIGGATGTDTALAKRKPETNYGQAKRIIYSVFPRATAAAALRVVGCETGYTYSAYSYNSSGASGYFQILTGNHGRTFSYRGKWFKLNVWRDPVHRIGNKLFNAWYNATAAYYMSRGGYDWHEWVCQP